jgi:SAM-dependent methyltransferase
MIIHYGPDYDRSITAANDGSSERTLYRRNFLTKYKQSGDVLDLGCSSGSFLGSLKGSAWSLYGVEMSQEIAELAEARTGAKVFVGDVLDAPFESNAFDAITCFHVFEHMDHPREVLQQVSDWLKPGGVFVSFMPNIDSAGAKIFGSYWYALELPRHPYHYSPSSLRYLAHAVGLEEVSIATHHELFLENSIRYLGDELFRRMHMPRTPLAKAEKPGIPFRIIRKAFRLTLRPVLEAIASTAGDGESLHAVFRKPAVTR